MNNRFHLSSLIYPADCLREAMGAYKDLCRVNVSEVNAAGCNIDITCVGAEGDERTVNEFLNYLLDLSVERHSVEQQH